MGKACLVPSTKKSLRWPDLQVLVQAPPDPVMTPARLTLNVGLGVALAHLGLLLWLIGRMAHPDAAPPRVQWVEAVTVTDLPKPHLEPKPQPAPALRRPEPAPTASPTPLAPMAVPASAPPLAPVEVRPGPPAPPGPAEASPSRLAAVAASAGVPSTPSSQSQSAETTPPSHAAAYLNNPPPAYPAISKRLGEQGRVVIRVYIDERGIPSQAQFSVRSGYSRLDQAAMDAVMSWRYVPAKRGEVPLAMWFNVPITFDLKQKLD